jgi:hypothetical protein
VSAWHELHDRCVTEGCNSGLPHKAHGMCERCYQRWKKRNHALREIGIEVVVLGWPRVYGKLASEPFDRFGVETVRIAQADGKIIEVPKSRVQLVEHARGAA